MATITEMLDEHNKLAKKLGKLTLSSWKQDKGKLQSRIDALSSEVTPVDKKPKFTKKDEEAIEKVAKKKVQDDNMLSVADVAEEIGMNPKVARAKLRRKGKKSNEGRWEMMKRNSDAHKDLIVFLKGANK